MSKDFQGWLDERLQEQSGPQPVSAKAEVLQQSIQEHSTLQKGLSEQEEPYSTIMREGEALLQSTEGAEKVALQGQLSALKSNWEDVKKATAERCEKLQGALQLAQKYGEQAEKLNVWLQESEGCSGGVKISASPAEVESSLAQVKAIQKDVDKHRGQVELLNTVADSLLEATTTDGEAIKEERAAIEKGVEKLSEELQGKKESLEKLAQKLKEFGDTQKQAKVKLEGARKQLENNEALGVQAYSNKNLGVMKAQQKTLTEVEQQVQQLTCLAQGLVVDMPEADGVTDLLLQADSLEKEHCAVSKDVEGVCSALEGKLQGIGQFQNSIREMFASFADLDDELDGMPPVARDMEAIRAQKDSIQGFMDKLTELTANAANAKDACRKMLEMEASPDLLGAKRDLEALSKQSGKLMDRAHTRQEQVEGTLGRMEELYQKLEDFTSALKKAEEQEDSQEPVGMETDVINQQLESFKVRQQCLLEKEHGNVRLLAKFSNVLLRGYNIVGK